MANSNNVKFFFTDDKSKYDALTQKDSLALYFIEDAETGYKALYKGANLIAVGSDATSAVSGLMSANDKKKLDAIDISELVTKSELESKGYLTEHQSLEDYAKKTEVPTKVSELSNDKHYLTDTEVTSEILELTDKYLDEDAVNAIAATGDNEVKSWVEKGYATKADLANVGGDSNLLIVKITKTKNSDGGYDYTSSHTYAEIKAQYEAGKSIMAQFPDVEHIVPFWCCNDIKVGFELHDIYTDWIPQEDGIPVDTLTFEIYPDKGHDVYVRTNKREYISIKPKQTITADATENDIAGVKAVYDYVENKLATGGSGSSAVKSVNGKTGEVVLSASDIITNSTEANKISVLADGTLEVSSLTFDKLVQNDDELIISGGNA